MAKEFNVAERVDASVEQAADDGRGFILDNNGGAGNVGAGQQIAALVDRYLDELTGFGIEDGAAARGLGRMGLGRRRGGRGFAWRWGAQK